jgi:Lysophospholipase
MFIGSERCISTTLLAIEKAFASAEGQRLGRIADFLRLMTRAFKCSFSTTGKFEPIPPLFVSAGEGAKGGRPLIQVVKIVKSDEEGSAMSATKAVFVLVHGGWHNHSAWDRVTPILEANGFATLTLDLPGAGANAIAPTSLGFARSTPLRSPPSRRPSPA